MNQKVTSMAVLLPILFVLPGCSTIGSKSASLSVIYGAAAVLSLLLLVGYYAVVHKRDLWLLLLFSSVAVVNAGYFALALSKTLESALWANRLSYFGSVFLPLSMLMSILKATTLSHKKHLPTVLVVLSVAMFLVAASPGYLDVYYKNVALATVNGVTVLQKEYGPLHHLYLIYLLLYLAAMIAVIVHAAIKKKLQDPSHAIILAVAVGANIGVWLLEQLVDIQFEILSISYLISELFLLGLHLMIAENEKRLSAATAELQSELAAAQRHQQNVSVEKAAVQFTDEQCERFASNLTNLTRTELVIYEFYISGKTTKEIMAALNIKENTLKYHNKNIYGKLGVSSRKQLVELARTIQAAQPRNAEPDI